MIVTIFMMLFLIIGFSSLNVEAMSTPEEILKMIIEKTDKMSEQEEELKKYDRKLEFKSYEKSVGLHVNPAVLGEEVSYQFNVLNGEEEVPLEMNITVDLITDDSVYDYLGMNDLFEVMDKQNEYEKWVIIDFELTVAESEQDVKHTITAEDFDFYFTREPDLRKLEKPPFDDSKFFESAEVEPGDTIEGKIVRMVPNYTDTLIRFGTGERKTHVFWSFEAEPDPNVVY